jgi:hypothetical protein
MVDHLCVRNSNGHSTEPCGTPCFTCSHVEDDLLNLLLFIYVLWYVVQIRSHQVVTYARDPVELQFGQGYVMVNAVKHFL